MAIIVIVVLVLGGAAVSYLMAAPTAGWISTVAVTETSTTQGVTTSYAIPTSCTIMPGGVFSITTTTVGPTPPTSTTTTTVTTTATIYTQTVTMTSCRGPDMMTVISTTTTTVNP